MKAGDFVSTLRKLQRTHGAGSKPDAPNLTPDQVAARWRGAYSAGTLRNWRMASNPRGPASVKILGRVLYPLHAVEEYEGRLLASLAESNP